MTSLDTRGRYALRGPTSANNGTDFAAGLQSLRDDVDALLAPFSSGLFSARPISTSGSPGKAGRRYLATDAGVEYIDLGTSWAQTDTRPILTALPTALLYEGREIYFLADATNRVVWRLRYNASGGSYKWEFVGGAPLFTQHNGFVYFTNAASPGDGGVAVGFAAPLAGDYMASFGARRFSPDANGYKATLYVVDGAHAVYNGLYAASASFSGSGLITMSPSVGSTGKLVGIGAGAVLRVEMTVDVAGVNSTADGRFLSVIPIRVG